MNRNRNRNSGRAMHDIRARLKAMPLAGARLRIAQVTGARP